MNDIQPPYKILVVDDEPDLQPLVEQRMRRYVRAGQYRFVFAQNGVEALERLRADDEIVIVLSDINMPKMDGLALLDQIPKVNPNIRSVIISAYGDMKNIRTAMNRGAFDFVTKPVDFDDLKLTIDRTLQQLLEWRDALGARDRLVALQNELNVASQMQQSILPKRFPQDPSYDVFASMKPARSVGGDFFDVMRLEGGVLGLAVADVSDKGVPAALFMMSSRTLLKGAAIGLGTPGEVLEEVNNLLCEDNESAMFVTLVYAVFDPSTRKLTFANGGHNTPALFDDGGNPPPPPLPRGAAPGPWPGPEDGDGGNSTRLPLTGGVALGLVPGLKYEQSSITLSPGDNVVLYTDGVTEAMNEDEEEFGMARLEGLFSESSPSGARVVNDRIFDAVMEFAGDASQSDDITCMTLRAGGRDH
ncbi:MAG: SpoIIE family protein phosphatase [Acidimicrobiia bacterium]|nr:SpoIIE family protein phosphatase [Acidimicrobiia bacterium]